MVRPVIIGCRTESFPAEQLYAFREFQPFGMILFAEAPKAGKDAVRHVIGQFRDAVQRPDAPVFIDQEGGAVNRLKPEFGHGWRAIPAAGVFADLARHDPAAAREAVYLNAQLIAADLHELGVTVNLAPVVDVFSERTFTAKDEGLHAASADLRGRMLGSDPRIVTDLGRAFCDGTLNQGIIPVIKHIPGYGRVQADPHYTVTRIDSDVHDLMQDFLPFNVLSDMPAAMTGHVTFSKIDPDASATLSPKVIALIRDTIGFKNLLITDAIEMNAIWPDAFDATAKDQFGMALPKPGKIGTITQRALTAGCDLVLHGDSSRDFRHTLEMLEAAHPLDHEKFRHIHTLLKPPEPHSFDAAHAGARLEALLKTLPPMGEGGTRSAGTGG